MKKLLIALMLCAPMTMFAQKFGHIDSQALLMSLPEAVAVQNELQAKGNEYQKQLEDMQKELQTKAEAYDKARRFSRPPRTTRRPSTTSSSVSSDRCSTRFARLLHLLLRRVVTSISWRRTAVSLSTSTTRSARISPSR